MIGKTTPPTPKPKTSKPKRALLSQVVQAQQPKTNAPSSTEGEATVKNQRTGRIGTKLIGGHFSEAAAKQFKIMAAEQGKTVQALLEDAINDLFKKYNKEPIA